MPLENNRLSWLTALHLSALLGIIGIPLGNIWGPLCIWGLKRKTLPEINVHAKECLNFQISMTIYSIISAFLIYFMIGFFLLLFFVALNLFCIIRASLVTSKGQFYYYPLSIKFLNS